MMATVLANTGMYTFVRFANMFVVVLPVSTCSLQQLLVDAGDVFGETLWLATNG